MGGETDPTTPNLPGTSSDDPPATDRDLPLLREAIAVSKASRSHGRHPFGAIVVDGAGKTIGSGENAVDPPDGDVTGHAEIVAIRDAWRRAGPGALAGATLYSSAEPCAMCSGAVYWSGIVRVVYALSEGGLLALTGSDPKNPTMSLPCREVLARGQRRIAVAGPLIEDEAAAAHAGFWARDRP